MKGLTMSSKSRCAGSIKVVAALLVALPVMAATPARAATDAEKAESLIREGVKLRGKDNAPQALPLFEQAYQISRTPRTAAQLGLCEQELGYYVAAERYLTEALAAPDHPWVSKNKAALKKALDTARANIGELALTLSPASADVSLNHKLVDRALLSAPIRLNKGPVDVEVTAPGYEPSRDAITIVGGKQEQRTYTLVASPPAPPPAVAVAPDPAPAVTLGSAPAESGGKAKGERIAAWITGGAAVGALVFGTVEALTAASRSSAFNDHTAVSGGVTYHDCGTADLSPACKSLKDGYDSALTLTVVGFAAAAALAAASSVLFVLSSPGRGGEPAGAARPFACVPDPVGRGVGCSLRF